MLRKISLLSLGSTSIVFCFLFSISVMASDKTSKHKNIASSANFNANHLSMIAELYLNFSYTYFPVSNAASLESIKKSEKNPDALVKKESGKIVITKDDFHYYFTKSNFDYSFLYAIKDNNIPLYDGFDYENEINIPIGKQIFLFKLVNGRPVGYLQSSN